MRKVFLTIVGLVIFSLALGLPFNVMAATVTFNASVTYELTSGNVTIENSSLVDEISVSSNTLTLTVGSDTNITIRSDNKYIFATNPDNIGTQTCSASSNSINITSPTGSMTVTPTTNTCTEDVGSGGGGGGGGGGAGPPPAAPTNTSIMINSDNAQTDSVSVTLTLGATNAATMLIANTSDFSDAGSWETYATSKSWTLTEGVGTKTVYSKFRSSSGGQSAAVSDTIELVEISEPTSNEVTAGGGGSVSLSDNKAAVSVPAGAISGSGTVSITPTSSYTAPSGNNKVIGGQVYDLTMTVDEEEVTTFDELVTLTFTYTDSEITGVNESTLAVYYWNETTEEWLNLGGTIDAENNTITVDSAHFTKFAIVGEVTTTGDLIKLACAAGAGVNDPCKAVYYLGNDGKRYVFPNEKTYKTWYDDFSTVKTVTAEEMASYQIKANVTYRPGVKLVKITTDPKVYAVGGNGTLRWVTTEAIAEELYGADWASQVDDVPDPFFINYTVGSDIESAVGYSKNSVRDASPDINTDKGLL